MGRNRRALLYGGLHPDPEVLVMKIEDASGRLRGVAYNYGCHPSTLDWQNTLISEDWPHYCNAAIAAGAAPGVRGLWTAYLQGAEGDINCGYSSELSAVGVDMPIRNYEFIEKKGMQLARAVLDLLPGILTGPDLDISLASGFFDYPLRKEYPVTEEEALAEAAGPRPGSPRSRRTRPSRKTRIADEARAKVFIAGQRVAVAAPAEGKGLGALPQGRAPGASRRRRRLPDARRRGLFGDRTSRQV